MREFRIQYAIGNLEKTNDLMRRFDVFKGDTGAVLTGIIKTENKLPFNKYKKLIEESFEKEGGKLYDIQEIIR